MLQINNTNKPITLHILFNIALFLREATFCPLLIFNVNIHVLPQQDCFLTFWICKNPPLTGIFNKDR